MAIYTILMATFDKPVPTALSGARSYTPFNEVKGISFNNATFSEISLEDDDANFDDTRTVGPDKTGQTLTEAIHFGNDPAAAPVGMQLTNFIHSTIEMLGPDGKATGEVFNVIFPVSAGGQVLGGKCSVLIMPVQTTTSDNVVVTPVFDSAATYTFKSHVSHGSASPPIPYPPQSPPPCFTAGTLIDTQAGPRPVETLRAGDYVRTRDNGLRRLHWVGGRELSEADLDLSPAFRPIRIRAGALGHGHPATDLTVSPQHRVLIQSGIARRLFGAEQVLVAAKHLTDLPGISVIRDGKPVAYWHLLFDGHELVRSNGAWTESLYLGPQALKAIGAAAQREIAMLLSEIAVPDGDCAPARARPFLSGQQGRKLARHLARQPATLIEA